MPGQASHAPASLQTLCVTFHCAMQTCGMHYISSSALLLCHSSHQVLTGETKIDFASNLAGAISDWLCLQLANPWRRAVAIVQAYNFNAVAFVTALAQDAGKPSVAAL